MFASKGTHSEKWVDRQFDLSGIIDDRIFKWDRVKLPEMFISTVQKLIQE